MKEKLWVIYFNVSLACVLLMGTELFGQIFYFALKGYPVFESDKYVKTNDQVFELHPYLVGRLKKNIRVEEKNKTITTTDIYTRWTGAPTDDRNSIRIAVLGGSSAFGTEVTDIDSWPALLQNTLGNGYSVINYGVPGYSTAEAIIQMALIVPESRPHIVVFYEGWNDIRNYHDRDLGPDYFDHGMKQYEDLYIPVKFGNNHEPLLARLVQVSAIFRFANIIAQMLPQRVQSQPHTNNEVYKIPDPFVDKIYLRNLKTLKTLVQSLGAKVIFIPQVLNYADFEGKKGSRRWSPHIEDDAMPALLDRFNLIMNDACLPEESNCNVLNEVLTENWKPSDFMDDGHFSRTGGIKFSKIVAKQIRETTSKEPIQSDAQQNAAPDVDSAVAHPRR
ncbi:MAG: hypothetical protein HY203_05830 [Nitrospirae bacterium]|nr:hypothetical protein [Nitrospirota bacterium]